MSESRTERSFKSDDAVRDDATTVEYPHGVPADTTVPMHEGGDVGMNVLGVAALVVGGLVILALVVAFVFVVVFNRNNSTQGQSGPTVVQATAPAAVQQRANPIAAWQAYSATAEAELNNYRWVDKEAGIAEIPITEAMKLTAQGVAPALSGTGSGTPAAPEATPTP